MLICCEAVHISIQPVVADLGSEPRRNKSTETSQKSIQEKGFCTSFILIRILSTDCALHTCTNMLHRAK